MFMAPSAIDDQSDAEQASIDGITWEIDGSGTLTINKDTETVIKDYTEANHAPWYNSRASIKLVILNGITQIGAYAFDGCTAMTDVSIPSTVKSINASAFNGCSSLTKVELPTGLTFLGEGVFTDCTSLKTINFPTGVTSIGVNTFSGCSKLKTANLVNVTNIDVNAFYECTALSEITFKDANLTIASSAFKGLSFFDGSTELNKDSDSLKGKTFYGSGVKTSSNDYRLYNSTAKGEFIVTFIVDSGMECSASHMVTVDQKLPTLPTVTGGTSTFVGWFTEKTGGTQITTNTTFTSGDNAYAQFLVPVTGISISKTSEKMTVNGEITLTATITPANATDKVVQWTTSDSNKATVTTTGTGTATVKVKALAIGSVTITAKSHYDTSKTAACTITISDIPVTGVTLDKATATMNVNDEITLTATVAPAGVVDKDILWTTSDGTKATVTATGTGTAKVKALAPGNITITAKSHQDPTKTAACVITVSDTPITSVKLDKTELILGLTEATKTYTLTPTVEPSTATNKKVTWTSSNEAVATVDANGKVTALKAGTATITAASQQDATKKDSCVVTVASVLVTGVTLDKTTADLDVGATLKLVPTITPADASIKTVTWTSSKKDVATVDSDGKVTGIAPGTATITVTTKDGGKTASCTVTVKNVEVKSITLDVSTLELAINNTYLFKAKVLPENATDNKIIWSSSDGSIVSIDQTGKITGLKEGKATIKATSHSSELIYGSCEVTVVDRAIESISIDGESEVEVNRTTTLRATYDPEDASHKGVTWSSGDTSIATINPSTGVVTGIKAGTVKITATSTSDPDKKATWSMTVTATSTIDTTTNIVGNVAKVTNTSKVLAEINATVTAGLGPVVTVDTTTMLAVTMIQVPTEIVTALKETENGALKVNTAEGTIKLPAAAMAKIDTTGATFVGIQMAEIEVPEKYKDEGYAAVYSLAVVVGDTQNEIKFGTDVTVEIYYLLGPGESVDDLKVAYLPADGKAEKISGVKYQNGKAVFTVTHFSEYAITFGSLPDSGGFPTAIVIVLVIIVALIGVVFYLYKYTYVLDGIKGKVGAPKSSASGPKTVNPPSKSNKLKSFKLGKKP